jgi:hypothetical protein
MRSKDLPARPVLTLNPGSSVRVPLKSPTTPYVPGCSAKSGLSPAVPARLGARTPSAAHAAS